MGADNCSPLRRRTALIASELSRLNTDTAASSETRLAHEGSLNEMASGYTFFWKGLPANSRRIHGVGFAIRTKLLQTLPESPVAISECLMTLRILHRKTSICHFHQHVCSNTIIWRWDLRSLLCDAAINVNVGILQGQAYCTVLGDSNARIGADSKIWGNFMGKHGVGNINSNGPWLLSVCSEFGVFVTNTLLQLKHKHKTTWIHPRSKHWHLLDYVLVKAVDLQDVQITRVMRGAECWTDHRLVRTSLQHRHSSPSPKTETSASTNVNGLGRRANLSSLVWSNLAQVSDCSTLPFQSSSEPHLSWSPTHMDFAAFTTAKTTAQNGEHMVALKS